LTDLSCTRITLQAIFAENRPLKFPKNLAGLSKFRMKETDRKKDGGRERRREGEREKEERENSSAWFLETSHSPGA
jgi:hypothetical protein